MTVERNRIGLGFWLQWVLASIVGLYVGLVMAFVLLAFIAIVLGLEYCDACDELTTIGLGIGVGVLQWLVLRRRISGAGWWVLASAAGGYGIIQAGFNGYSESLWNSYDSILGWTGVVALGGAVTGILQWLVLRGAGLPSWLMGVSKHRGLGVGHDSGDSIIEGRRR